MKKFKIEIEEYFSKTIEVESVTQEEAIKIVKKLYDEEKVILDYSDFVDKKINLLSGEI